MLLACLSAYLSVESGIQDVTIYSSVPVTPFASGSALNFNRIVEFATPFGVAYYEKVSR